MTDPRYNARDDRRRYIGRYSTREQAERVSATYGDFYPNRTVEPEEVGGRVDWLIWTVPDAD